MPRIPPSSGIPYQGWTWRGARLEAAELAAYTTGAQTRHLGVADTRTGGEREFPVLFRVYARQAWATPGNLEEVRFPPDAEFLVREVRSLSGDRICIHLEQATEDAGSDPALAREFRAWLPMVIGPLPRPDPDLEARWAAPFACWYRGAQAGDAPRTGIVYDTEDACRFVMEGTGRDGATVRKVLEAMQRYLELADLSEASRDGDLEREREAMRHLLPEVPGVIENEPRLAYLALATGLGEEVLEDILDVEFRYCDSIGLLEPEEEEGIHRILDDHRDHWEAAASDQIFYRMDVALSAVEDPFILPVYAPAGFRPRLGEVVRGRLWLQGGLPKGRGAHAIFGC